MRKSRLNKVGIIGISLVLTFFNTNQRFAKEIASDSNSKISESNLTPIKVISGTEKLELNVLSSSQLSNLAKNQITLNFNGTTCRYIMGKGCVVTKSGKANYRIGSLLSTYTTPISSHLFHPVAYEVNCSWCGFAGDDLGIVVFVVTAPASAPATLVFATYTAGIGFILSHA